MLATRFTGREYGWLLERPSVRTRGFCWRVRVQLWGQRPRNLNFQHTWCHKSLCHRMVTQVSNLHDGLIWGSAFTLLHGKGKNIGNFSNRLLANPPHCSPHSLRLLEPYHQFLRQGIARCKLCGFLASLTDSLRHNLKLCWLILPTGTSAFWFPKSFAVAASLLPNFVGLCL